MNQRYIIMGTSKSGHDEGETVYMDIDDRSGGYPFWTSAPQRAQSYESVERALNAMTDYLFREARDVKVCTLEYVATPVRDVTPDLTALKEKLATARANLLATSRSLQDAINRASSPEMAKYARIAGEQGEQITQLQNQLNSITN